ncbi:hypothetical protein JG687_00011396 [Phytophthora cactorum]|uniref:Uncharacterized protein n=1 Tax=Phytophthora cactorum TaxID=29920 RepID=A0A8T1U4F7_9STRA|nr:hypothetical protein JG687_00011396 [Phytophthora cactorum]
MDWDANSCTASDLNDVAMTIGDGSDVDVEQDAPSALTGVAEGGKRRKLKLTRWERTYALSAEHS